MKKEINKMQAHSVCTEKNFTKSSQQPKLKTKKKLYCSSSYQGQPNACAGPEHLVRDLSIHATISPKMLSTT